MDTCILMVHIYCELGGALHDEVTWLVSESAVTVNKHNTDDYVLRPITVQESVTSILVAKSSPKHISYMNIFKRFCSLHQHRSEYAYE